MATNFSREPKMQTTEPSDDEVGQGMKRGGRAHKKHMADGGVPMVTPRVMPAMASRARMMARPRMAMPVTAPPVAGPMKKGGHAHKKHMAEGGMSDMAQDKAMIKKAFKEHDAQEHKGGKGTHLHLKHGGKTHHYAKGGNVKATGVKDAGTDVPGGLLGGIEATKAVPGTTGGVRSPGYKRGGHAHKKHMADGGTLHPAIDVNDKVVSAKQVKSLNTKTAGVEGKGYKHGGHTKKHHYAKGGTVSDGVSSRYVNDMVDGEHMPTKKGGTKSISQAPAGYKKGGHVTHHAHGGHIEHHTTHGHKDHGHDHMHEHMSKHKHGHEKAVAHPMKHGGGVKHHTTKMSTHMKKGGACNY